MSGGTAATIPAEASAGLPAGAAGAQPNRRRQRLAHSQAGRSSPHELILATGDWQSGAKIDSQGAGASSEQDVATARRRVALLWDAIDRRARAPVGGLSYRKLHIIALGDLIETEDLRRAPDRRPEELITVQTIQVFELFTWLCRQALTIFPQVEVELVSGSHDRVTGNGDAALRELDDAETVSFLIGEFARRQFVNERRIKVRNWKTCFGYKKVAEQRVVFARGGSSTWNGNGYGGLPWYHAPLLPRSYAEMLGKAEITIVGQGDRPAILPEGRGWLRINGSLAATGEDEPASIASVQRPSQWLLSVHEQHGLTGCTPVYLELPRPVPPGEAAHDREGDGEGANAELGLALVDA